MPLGMLHIINYEDNRFPTYVFECVFVFHPLKKRVPLHELKFVFA